MIYLYLLLVSVVWLFAGWRLFYPTFADFCVDIQVIAEVPDDIDEDEISDEGWKFLILTWVKIHVALGPLYMFCTLIEWVWALIKWLSIGTGRFL